MSLTPTGKHQYLRTNKTPSKIYGGKFVLHKPQFKKSKTIPSQIPTTPEFHFMQQYKFFSFCRMVSAEPHLVKTLSRKEFREKLYPHGIDYSDCFEATCKIFYNPDRVIEEDLKEIEDEMQKANSSEEEITEDKEAHRAQINFKYNLMVVQFGFFEINDKITEILTKYPNEDMFKRIKLYYA